MNFPIVIVLDNIRSSNNVGSLFRTADSLGASRLDICGISATPPNRDIHKTALGAELTVDWSYERETQTAIEKLHGEGFCVLAVEQTPGAVMLQDFEVDPAKKYALVFGNEVDGIPYDIIAMCDGAIELPQLGAKKSLNVAVCGGIVMWKFYTKFAASKP